MSITNNNVDQLKAQGNAYYEENLELKIENAQLKHDLAEMKRKQKIAVDNAYEAGYRAGQEDKHKPRS